MEPKINTRLLKEIKEMFDADQELRMLWGNAELTKPLSQWGKNVRQSAKKTQKWGLASYLVYFVDAAHNPRIYRIIEKYGYPTQKLIGAKGMDYFWLLIQHQDYDIELQKKCLENCNFNKKNEAYLADRILIHEGKKQTYGTQFERDTKNNRIVSQPIADKKNINQRRKKMGLQPLKDDLLFMNKKFYRK